MTVEILRGDNRETLKTLKDKSINMVVTSPPYWGLRDYGTATWVGGDPNCPHMRLTKISKNTTTGHAGMFKQGNVVGDAIYKSVCPKCGAKRMDSQLGLEETPEEYVNNLVGVFREIKRVLRDDGTVWLNLGDSYSSGGRRTTTNQSLRGDKDYGVTRPAPSKGIKPKDLIGIPWRVAFALQQDGWYLRQDIIWHKPNPMPESVRDRCTKAHEYIFLLSKNVKYYYDHEAIKEPITDSTAKRLLQKNIDNQKGSERAHAGEKPNGNMKALGRKKFDSSMGGGGTSFVGHSGYKKSDGSYMISPTRNKRSVWTVTTKPFKEAHFATFPMDLIEPCILAGCPEAGTVLDPFGGSGTTGIVASNHNRNAILCELNDEYSDIAEKRMESNFPLFSAKN
tara:strand:+ start:1574 stop:2755 length:1182 start_codon:yes stop_codon:yes gene_type:complete